MKAIFRHNYGSPDVLELKNIDKPAVNDDDVLVRVHAVGLHAGDWHIMTGRPAVPDPTRRLWSTQTEECRSGFGFRRAG